MSRLLNLCLWILRIQSMTYLRFAVFDLTWCPIYRGQCFFQLCFVQPFSLWHSIDRHSRFTRVFGRQIGRRLYSIPKISMLNEAEWLKSSIVTCEGPPWELYSLHRTGYLRTVQTTRRYAASNKTPPSLCTTCGGPARYMGHRYLVNLVIYTNISQVYF